MGMEDAEEPTQPTSKLLAVIIRLLHRIEDAIHGVSVGATTTTTPAAGPTLVTVNMQETPITTDGVHLLDEAFLAATPKDLWKPDANLCAQVKSLEVSTDSASKIQFFWGTSEMAGYFLPNNGTVLKNFTGCNEKGPKGTKLTVVSSANANIIAKAVGIEVAP